MKKVLLMGALALACTGVNAQGLYYEFQGPVTKIVDKTADKVLTNQYAGGVARYVVYADPAEVGFFYSSTGKKVFPKDDSRNTYNYASYTCGNALNLAYLDSDYYFVEQKNTSTLKHTKFSVGRRLDISVEDVFLPNLVVNDVATAIESYQVPGTTVSTVSSALTLIGVHETNPCQ
ncbi:MULTISPECIES: hypothetical protein [Aeromonas]|uniref:Uncharacterized protein n=1 Tax=Aeromonas caviae TaxID=648 RepID=A0AAJ5ZAN4_AERCA|nr:hypothetical protein [Aeromonas caviae]WFG00168.1 hypothetical protein P5S46_21985 [Aeromonas caviae]WVM47898.1 hypothetical protein V0242_25175 [Aeromonas hydrophila]